MGEVPIFSGQAKPYISSDLIGRSPAMARLRELVRTVGAADATVLVTGASGTGKENVARALHAASGRATGPFEAVNCGAIPADLAESELFGAEAGAYTGAVKTRIGRLEAANGGTLFLDEIGELPLPLQVKLLRVLETREIQRLGSTRSIPVDFRLVTATNVDLDEAVAMRRFREDLYWRIAVVWIELPLLVARLEDIPALIAHFARRAKSPLPLQLTPCGIEVLAAHSWPGNLRELRSVVERALAHQQCLLDGATVRGLLRARRRSMDSWLSGEEGKPSPTVLPAAGGADGRSLAEQRAQSGRKTGFLELKTLLAETEAALIQQALVQSNGTVAQSARLLGLKRTTLVEKMRRMGLRPMNEVA